MEKALDKTLSTIIRVANPDKVILFGSRAKGPGGSESDYDILVLKKGVKNPRELGRKIYRNFSRIGASVPSVLLSGMVVEESILNTVGDTE